MKSGNNIKLNQLNKSSDFEEIKQGIKRIKTKKTPEIDCI